MTLPRRHPGLLVGAAGAGLMVVALWLPWYGLSLPSSVHDALGGSGPGSAGAYGPLVDQFITQLAASIHVSGWQALHGADTALLCIAVCVAILVALDEPGLMLTAGLTAAAIVGWHLVDQPGPDRYVAIREGAWLALTGTGLIVFGAWWGSVPGWVRRRGSAPRVLVHTTLGGPSSGPPA
jgi:hypothetical protein